MGGEERNAMSGVIFLSLQGHMGTEKGEKLLAVSARKRI